MSSRVEQENQAKAAEAERLQKRIEREGRDAKTGEATRQAFASVMKGQQGTKQADKSAQDGRASEQQQAKGQKQAGEADRAARMARGGVLQQSRVMEQARSFQGVLQSGQASTQEADRARGEARVEGSERDRVEAEDRSTDVARSEDRREVEREQVRAESRLAGGASASVDADGHKKQGQEQRGGGEQGQQQRSPQAVAAAGKAAPTTAVKQIPPEMLEKLVSAVYVGVNDKGLREFQIELKDGPLKGATLKITADNGKVGLTFLNLGADEKRLVEASKGELMRRLETKGLALAKLDVR